MLSGSSDAPLKKSASTLFLRHGGSIVEYTLGDEYCRPRKIGNMSVTFRAGKSHLFLAAATTIFRSSTPGEGAQRDAWFAYLVYFVCRLQSRHRCCRRRQRSTNFPDNPGFGETFGFVRSSPAYFRPERKWRHRAKSLIGCNRAIGAGWHAKTPPWRGRDKARWRRTRFQRQRPDPPPQLSQPTSCGTALRGDGCEHSGYAASCILPF